MQLLIVRCGWCRVYFFICRRCWRGQAYCGNECRRAAKRHAHRKAERKYRRTAKGRRAHREAERRRRMGIGKKTVADRGSTLEPAKYKMSLSKGEASGGLRYFQSRALVGRRGRCHFCGICGVIVDKFPRRGYGTGEPSKRC